MENLAVFTGEKELSRLQTQRQLMRTCEEPVLRELLAGRSELNVLDVGCNDGEKTVRWFSDPAISRVLGLEYNTALARQAHETHGGEIFSFYPCDVEAKAFPAILADLMQHEGIEGFDVIYLSFVLSHLTAPETLLRRLREVLKPGGVLIAVETDDSKSFLEPEGGELLNEFLALLRRDPYAGDRDIGGRLPRMLRGCGFAAPALCCDAISAGPGEQERKAQIFEMFFSFLPEDVPILRDEAPGEPYYADTERWLAENFEELKRRILAEQAHISMGMAVVTCGTEPMKEERSARP